MAILFDISIPAFTTGGGKSDDPWTLSDQKEDHEVGTVDATTKRHYTINAIYEWDESKRIANIEKHGLDFVNADRVFESEFKVTLRSGKGGTEIRFVDYGKLEGASVALIYTMRNDAVRIISFRPAKRTERRVYDAAFKNR